MLNEDYKLFLDINFDLISFIDSFELEFFYRNRLSFFIPIHIDIMFFKMRNLIKEFNLLSIVII